MILKVYANVRKKSMWGKPENPAIWLPFLAISIGQPRFDARLNDWYEPPEA